MERMTATEIYVREKIEPRQHKISVKDARALRPIDLLQDEVETKKYKVVNKPHYFLKNIIG